MQDIVHRQACPYHWKTFKTPNIGLHPLLSIVEAPSSAWLWNFSWKIHPTKIWFSISVGKSRRRTIHVTGQSQGYHHDNTLGWTSCECSSQSMWSVCQPWVKMKKIETQWHDSMHSSINPSINLDPADFVLHIKNHTTNKNDWNILY